MLIVGDSLSAGYGLSAGDEWPALLQQRLEVQGYPHRVVNASTSGETTAGGLARIERALDRHAPDIVLIALGGNDGLRGTALAETERNLARMIETAQTAGATVLIASVRLPPNYGPAFAQRFEAMYDSLGERYAVPVVDLIPEVFGERTELLQDDGIHPTAAAQPLLLDQVWRHLEPTLGD